MLTAKDSRCHFCYLTKSQPMGEKDEAENYIIKQPDEPFTLQLFDDSIYIKYCPECGRKLELYNDPKDQKSKQALIDYLVEHDDERLFQAIRNFIALELNKECTHLIVHNEFNGKDEDTFEWEGDAILETNKWNGAKEKLK